MSMRRPHVLAAVILAAAAALLLAAVFLSASTIWWAATMPAIVLAVILGLAVPVSPTGWRRTFLAVNCVFVLWTLLTVLRYFEVLPPLPWWTLMNVTLLGLILHFVWWLLADVLLGLLWLTNRLGYGLRARVARSPGLGPPGAVA